MAPFDPSVYETKHDFQDEPNLPAEQWKERFIAHLISEGGKQAREDFKKELPDYARGCVDSYHETRRDFGSPEEAADCDISYWENEE